jgi:uncharacterized protein (PEP-CTERM system associated)
MATTRAIRRTERDRVRGSGRAGVAGGLVAASLLAVAVGADAQSTLKFTPSVSVDVTITNNVDLNSDGSRQSDTIFTISPGFLVDYQGPRGFLQGSVGVPIVLYARTGESNNEVYPSASLRGQLEVIDDLFFVDASATVAQTFYSPFGSRPAGLTNATDNRYTSQSYTVSPFLRGNIGSDISWSIRQDNYWSNLTDAPEVTDAQYINRLFATINRQPLPIGWGADVERTEYRFADQGDQILSLARARVAWRPVAQWEFFLSGGYESNEFPLFDSSGPIYGAGARWRPTERTTLDASWEHRFFGESYDFLFAHRLPLSVWSIRASRNLQSYPEFLARLPEGTFVPGILNQILQNRINDPAERARFIAEYMANRGLPVFLDEPISVYTQRLYVYDYAAATAGLLGVRNSVFFTVYRSRQQPITGAGDEIPSTLTGEDNNTQVGAGLVWTYQVSPFTSFTMTADAFRAEAEPPKIDRSDQVVVRGVFTRPISPNTTAYFGARWQNFNSNVNPDWREAAVFAGFSHSFR